MATDLGNVIRKTGVGAFRIQRQFPAVRFGDSLGIAQPESGSRTYFFGREEWLAHLFLNLLRYAAATIANRNLQVLTAVTDRALDHQTNQLREGSPMGFSFEFASDEEMPTPLAGWGVRWCEMVCEHMRAGIEFTHLKVSLAQAGNTA